MWPVPWGSTTAAGGAGRAHHGASSVLLAGGPAGTMGHPHSVPGACWKELSLAHCCGRLWLSLESEHQVWAECSGGVSPPLCLGAVFVKWIIAPPLHAALPACLLSCKLPGRLRYRLRSMWFNNTLLRTSLSGMCKLWSSSNGININVRLTSAEVRYLLVRGVMPLPQLWDLHGVLS